MFKRLFSSPGTAVACAMPNTYLRQNIDEMNCVSSVNGYVYVIEIPMYARDRACPFYTLGTAVTPLSGMS